MAHRRMSENEAHKMLLQTAMNQKRRLVDVAESMLAMADYLPLDAAPGAERRPKKRSDWCSAQQACMPADFRPADLAHAPATALLLPIR